MKIQGKTITKKENPRKVKEKLRQTKKNIEPQKSEEKKQHRKQLNKDLIAQFWRGSETGGGFGIWP